MRILLYIIILVLLFCVPVDRLDIAKLQPIEAVAIYVENEMVVLETDTEAMGRGASVNEALEDLKNHASAIIYLDTAEFLLSAPNAKAYKEDLKQYLKPSVQEGIYAGGSVKEEAKYLDVHTNRAKPFG